MVCLLFQGDVDPHHQPQVGFSKAFDSRVQTRRYDAALNIHI
jgi:hypothetical protein